MNVTGGLSPQAVTESTGGVARVALLVLGMHRSGTSAVTRLLNLLGAALPTQLMPPSPADNPTGFWESQEITDIHDELLASVGSSWDDVSPMAADWHRSITAAPFRERIVRILRRDFDGSALFVLKDPRMCRLVPFWISVLDEFGAQPRFVIPVRNPLEVAASLKARDGFHAQRSQLLWLRHLLEAEAGSRRFARSFLTFDQLLGDWRRVADRLNEELQLRWPEPSSATVVAIDGFLQQRLRHQSLSRQDLDASSSVLPWVREAYGAVMAAIDGSNDQMERVFDRVRSEFDGADRIFGPVVAEGRLHLLERNSELRSLRDELERTSAGFHAVAAESAARLGEIDRLRAESDARGAELERVSRTPRATEAESAVRFDEGRRLSEEIAAHRQEIRRLRSSAGDRASLPASRPAAAIERWRARRRTAASGLFLASYYLSQKPDLEADGADPLWHYLQRGAADGLDPHPLFSTRFYLGRNPDVASSGMNPLVHFVNYGARELRSPHPLFDVRYYVERAPGLDPAVENPLAHYLRTGARDGLDPHPLFHSSFYQAANGRTRDLGDNPLVHYVVGGARDGCLPNPLFDSAYYLERYPDVRAADLNPLAHYIEFGAVEGRDPHPLFSTRFYLEQHPELNVQQASPLQHFFAHGVWQDRKAWPVGRALHLTSPYIEKPEAVETFRASETRPGSRSSRRPLSIGVSSSSEGNYFFREIRDLLVAGLEAAGATAVACDEHSLQSADASHHLIVAPHEFFVLGRGTRLAQNPIASGQIVLNTEQLQSQWFIRALPYLLRARHALDMNAQTAGAVGRLGIASSFLPLGFVAGCRLFDRPLDLPQLPALEGLSAEVRRFDTRTDRGLAGRPLDLLFIGGLTQRRAEFFARAAPVFSRLRHFFHIPEVRGPLVTGKSAALTTEAALELSRRSKILLNVHQETSYFEWHRIVMHGIWQKTLVVSEPCFRVPGFRPGEHYLEYPLEQIPAAIDRLLGTDEGARQADEVREAGYALLRERFDLSRIMGGFLERIAEADR